MTWTEPPRLNLPDPADLEQAPQLAILTALDATLVATTAALDVRHSALSITCWGPDATEDVRLAAAIVAAALALYANS